MVATAALAAPLLPAASAQADAGNVAAGATVSQSSTGWGGAASRAVDGNTNGVYANNSVTHTNADPQAWWAADLTKGYGVRAVTLWNRTDGYSDRLSNFYLLASDTPIASTDLTTARNQAGVTSYYVASLTGPSVTIAVNRSAQYLRVQLVGTNYLSLAEVQVVATPLTTTRRDLAPAGQATQSSTYPGHPATLANDGDTSGASVANAHTNSEAQPWWALDLRSKEPLTNVVVWNRTDCCTDRLANFYLLASDNPITSTDLTTARNQAGVSSYYVATMTGASQTIAVNRSARFLRVQLVGTNYLNIAEVQVYGPSMLMEKDASGWVHNNKFGMFMHFNMSTMTNVQWADPNASPSLFNPSNVDTDQWADAIKSAGMTFGVLTAKHHDGFALWPTAYSDHSVQSSPWKNGNGDLVRDYVTSMRAKGLKVGIYFSILDWHNGNSTELIENQLRELLTNYGQIDYLWFDGWDWNGSSGAVSYSTVPYQPVRDFISHVSPATLVANNDHRSSLATTDVMVWEVPVQGFPPNNSVPKDASDTLCPNNTWFYTTSTGTPKAAATIKSNKDSVNAGNALFLLNVGPDKTGQITQPYRDRLAEIGALG
ncbi:alpha-L-fucosidase [Longispora sp. K20-0274]|uniref:alpha-L-fucosidase n=1 Tax=Longispora sp. K20-0274 TaxID=3088255 RepID=UPI00399A824C